MTEPFTKDSTDNTKTEAVNKKAEAEAKKAVEVTAVVSDWLKLLLKMTFDWSKLLSTCLI